MGAYPAPMPLFHECQQCAACCRWPGQVRVSDAEIDHISDYLGLERPKFINQFTRLRPDRKGLALNETPNGECIFLKSAQCSIQAVKPQQCRDFPNLWRNPGKDALCQAIPVQMGVEEYWKRVAAATGRSIQSLESTVNPPEA